MGHGFRLVAAIAFAAPQGPGTAYSDVFQHHQLTEPLASQVLTAHLMAEAPQAAAMLHSTCGKVGYPGNAMRAAVTQGKPAPVLIDGPCRLERDQMVKALASLDRNAFLDEIVTVVAPAAFRVPSHQVDSHHGKTFLAAAATTNPALVLFTDLGRKAQDRQPSEGLPRQIDGMNSFPGHGDRLDAASFDGLFISRFLVGAVSTRYQCTADAYCNNAELVLESLIAEEQPGEGTHDCQGRNDFLLHSKVVF